MSVCLHFCLCPYTSCESPVSSFTGVTSAALLPHNRQLRWLCSEHGPWLPALSASPPVCRWLTDPVPASHFIIPRPNKGFVKRRLVGAGAACPHPAGVVCEVWMSSKKDQGGRSTAFVADTQMEELWCCFAATRLHSHKPQQSCKVWSLWALLWLPQWLILRLQPAARFQARL